jgi:hypothetical protein
LREKKDFEKKIAREKLEEVGTVHFVKALHIAGILFLMLTNFFCSFSDDTEAEGTQEPTSSSKEDDNTRDGEEDSGSHGSGDSSNSDDQEVRGEESFVC